MDTYKNIGINSNQPQNGRLQTKVGMLHENGTSPVGNIILSSIYYPYLDLASPYIKSEVMFFTHYTTTIRLLNLNYCKNKL